MEHYEYYLIIEGAHAADIITDSDGNVISNGDAGYSPRTLDEWIEYLVGDEPMSEDAHVHRIAHRDHKIYDECECHQYETDHSPYLDIKQERTERKVAALSSELAEIEETTREARTARDRAIVELYESGSSLRYLGHLAGMSHENVRRIVTEENSS